MTKFNYYGRKEGFKTIDTQVIVFHEKLRKLLKIGVWKCDDEQRATLSWLLLFEKIYVIYTENMQDNLLNL